MNQTGEMSVAGPRPAGTASARPVVRGKFLFTGAQKLLVKGVTYGPFRPDASGVEYGTPDGVQRDFAAMAAWGFNAVRTYTVPPIWLLDAAAAQGLRVMVGLPWEQHVTFLAERRTRRRIEGAVRDGARRCRNHPALLAYAVGNEIPSPIVRWHGRRPVEAFIRRLHHAVKDVDPDALATYVNYPTTEYLELPFVDLLCFNVYLESQDRLAAYLARLQNLAGDRPLVMGEIGLDSLAHGEDGQAAGLDWQVRSAFAAGCAGTFVFAWTDEWYRGGTEVDGWAFGLTDRERRPKPALTTVSRACADAPFTDDRDWPRVSVVVCTHNGRRTIRECLAGLARLRYPDHEVIVVDDGSTDGVAQIAGDFHVRLVRIDNGGLSRARNIGLRAASGEIVVYIDDDAWPDRDWLAYLVQPFDDSRCVAVGGPNLPPTGDGPVARSVANSPGGPNHVLWSDDEAEHIPGCNMAFRKSALEAVGGFDEQFRIAGDDVDLCWRLQERDGVLRFHHAAVVWHHRRGTVRAYLRQQFNYGRAEAMLEIKWPSKYNHFGHVNWEGRMYGGARPRLLRRSCIYHGVWGSEPFQSLYTRTPGIWRSLPLMPEWYLVIVALLLLVVPGLMWKPLLLALPLLGLALGAPLVEAAWSASQASLGGEAFGRVRRWRVRLLALGLHLAQPLARLTGRLSVGLTPWRRRGTTRVVLPWPGKAAIWCERWASLTERLESLERALRRLGAISVRGGAYDRWDLEVRGGLFGAVRVRMTIEEHGGGHQMVRLRSWPRVATPLLVILTAFGTMSMMATWWNHDVLAAVLSLAFACAAGRAIGDCGAATATYRQAIAEPQGSE